MAYSPSSFLVASHEPEVLDAISPMIRRFFPSAELRTSTNGQAALESIILHSPAIVIADAELTEMNGFALCDEVKSSKSLQDVYFILLVDRNNNAQKVDALEHQCDDFITRPPEPAEVLSKLRSATRISRLHADIRNERRKLSFLAENVKNTLDELLYVAVGVIHARIPDSKELLQRMAAAGVWMAKAFEDLNDQQIENVRVAASLCIIGKLYLPDSLINQAVSLDGEATHDLMYQVPLYSERLLKPSKRLGRVALITRHIFENYDGTGFPDRLQKREIPIEARIIRPIMDYEMYCIHQKKKPLEALESVKRNAKRFYDPRFTALLDEYLWSISPETLVHNVKAVQIYDLEEGMVIARDLVANSGLKLVSAGNHLSKKTVDRLLMHNYSDPIVGAIYIVKKD